MGIKVIVRVIAVGNGLILMHLHKLPLLDVAHGTNKTASSLIIPGVRKRLTVKVHVLALGLLAKKYIYLFFIILSASKRLNVRVGVLVLSLLY